MPRPRHRHRPLLIHRRTQLRSAFAAGASVVAYSAILGFLIFFPLHQELARDASPALQERAADQVVALHRRVWPAVLAVALMVSFHSVLTTHRLLGPVYRLKVAMAALREGDLGYRVTLRRNDRLKDLADSFNELAAHLERAQAERVAPRDGLPATGEGAVGLEAAAGAPPEGRGAPPRRS